MNQHVQTPPEIDRELLETLPVGIAVFASRAGNEHTLLYCNDEICRISGFTRAEIEAGPPFDICKAIESDAPAIAAEIKSARTSGLPTKAVYRTKTKSGALKYIQVTASVVQKEAGVLHTYVVYNDITAQEEKRVSAQRQNEELQHIVNTVPGGVFRCRRAPGWEMLEANEGFFRFIGYTKEEFSRAFQNSIAAITHPDDIPEIAAAMHTALESGNRVNTQNRLLCKGGAVKWIDMQAERSFDENGNECLYCIFVDITQQADLKQQLALYRSSKLSGVFSVAVDDDFTLLYGNDKYYQIHEYTEQGMRLALQNRCALYVHPDDLPQVKKSIQDTLARGETYAEWVMRVITGAGHLRFILCSGIFRNEGERTVMDGVVMDITAQKETEAALRDSESKLRIATEKSDVAFWTYDFRKKSVALTAVAKKLHGGVDKMENVPESLIASGYVRRDCAQAFCEMYQKLAQGAKTASGDFWFQTPEQTGWWCEHIEYENFFDDAGKPLYAHAIGKDVTAIKNAESGKHKSRQAAAQTQI